MSWWWLACWRLRRGCLASRRRVFCRTRIRARSSRRCGLPEGASLNRTEAVVKQVEDIVKPIPGVEGVLSVVGLNFIDYVASSNQAFFVIRLKPYEERTDPAQSANAIIARLRPQLAAIEGAIAFPFNLPPILGLGNTGGFQYVLEALQGQSPTDVAAVLRGVNRRGQQPARARRSVQHLCCRHAANLSRHRSRQGPGARRQDQRYFQCAAIDAGQFLRQRLQRFRHEPGKSISRRTHQFRDSARTISSSIYVRNAKGGMVPIRALAQAKLVQGPQTVVRYNGYRGAV